MKDIKDTISEYKASCNLVKDRIHTLNRLIADSEDSQAAKLNERRYLLYTELWEMEQAIREMSDYACKDRKANHSAAS